MAIQFEDGVIIGADTRTTTGVFVVNRVTDKLTPVHDNIFCCRSGSAADTQAVADIIHYYLQMYAVQSGESPTVQIASSMFQEVCYNNKDHLLASIIVAGWDKYEGGSVYTVPIGGSLHKLPFASAGSGSTFIHGYCDSAYRKGMTKDEAIQFIKTAITLAISRDGSSGGCIRLAIVTKDGIETSICFGDELPLPESLKGIF